MKRNATQPKTRATLRAACRKALACALSAVLVVGLAPTFSIAEAAEDEADAAANAVGDGAAEGAADGFVAPDAMSGTGSQVVSIPEDSTTIHAAVALEGDDSEAASAQSGEVGLPGSPAENAIRDTTSLSAKGGDTASSAAVDGNAAKAPAAVADESNGDGDGASANAVTFVSQSFVIDVAEFTRRFGYTSFNIVVRHIRRFRFCDNVGKFAIGIRIGVTLCRNGQLSSYFSEYSAFNRVGLCFFIFDICPFAMS